MTFRDDLDAAAARIASLEQQLQNFQSGAELRRLERRCSSMERTIALGRVSPAETWLACWLTPVLAATIWIAAFVIVAGRSEAGAWETWHASIAVCLLGSAFGWGRARAIAWGAVATLAKVVALAAWGWPWWSPFEAVVRRATPEAVLDERIYRFIFGAPVVLLGVVIVEAVILSALFRRLKAEHDVALPQRDESVTSSS